MEGGKCITLGTLSTQSLLQHLIRQSSDSQHSSTFGHPYLPPDSKISGFDVGEDRADLVDIGSRATPNGFDIGYFLISEPGPHLQFDIGTKATPQDLISASPGHQYQNRCTWKNKSRQMDGV